METSGFFHPCCSPGKHYPPISQMGTLELRVSAGSGRPLGPGAERDSASQPTVHSGHLLPTGGPPSEHPSLLPSDGLGLPVFCNLRRHRPPPAPPPPGSTQQWAAEVSANPKGPVLWGCPPKLLTPFSPIPGRPCPVPLLRHNSSKLRPGLGKWVVVERLRPGGETRSEPPL